MMFDGDGDNGMPPVDPGMPETPAMPEAPAVPETPADDGMGDDENTAM